MRWSFGMCPLTLVWWTKWASSISAAAFSADPVFYKRHISGPHHIAGDIAYERGVDTSIDTRDDRFAYNNHFLYVLTKNTERHRLI